MKILWCWQCKMEVPMLNEQEFKAVFELYEDAFTKIRKGISRQNAFEPLITLYHNLTGSIENNPNTILHHRIKMYGNPCENCGKPFKTPLADTCSACGSKKTNLIAM